MADLKVRDTIPDSWADNAHCILCGFHPLKVERISDSPDRIICSRCGLAIELEESGVLVRIAQLPVALKGGENNQEWKKVNDLRNYLKYLYEKKTTKTSTPFISESTQSVSSLNTSASSQAQPDDSNSNTPEETSSPIVLPENLVTTAKELYQLKNPSSKIRNILTESKKYTPEQIDAVIHEIELDERKNSKRGVMTVTAVAVVALVLCSLLAGILFWVTSTLEKNKPALSQISTSVSAARTEYPPVVPAEIQTNVPPSSKVFNVPTPVIEKLPTNAQSSRAGFTACPRNNQDAANLFGGNVKNWSSREGQWIMMDNNGTTLYIPDGMTGGYLLVESGLEMKSVLGPARVSNVYMMVISCN